MTVAERIKEIITNADLEKDTMEKLVYIAYYMGREQATKEVTHLYKTHLAKQTERAKACRYRHMAEKILDNGKGYIYTSDYRGEITQMFGRDKTKFIVDNPETSKYNNSVVYKRRLYTDGHDPGHGD